MTDWWNDDHALAYATLEQGRVACSRLLGAEGPSEAARHLETAHDGFGRAGYAVSDGLPEGLRPAIWLLVHEAGPAPLPGVTGVEHALMFAVHGTAMIERCLTSPWLTAQMEVAHRAVREAHIALTSIVGLGAAAQRALDAARTGELRPARQALRLRPPRLDEAGAATRTRQDLVHIGS